jgi:hypothetical protein
MCRLGLLLMMSVTMLGSGCGSGGGEAVAPKTFAPPPTEEPTMLGGKAQNKAPGNSD